MNELGIKPRVSPTDPSDGDRRAATLRVHAHFGESVVESAVQDTWEARVIKLWA